MARKPDIATKTLMAWGEQESLRQSHMLGVAIGIVLHKMGERCITITDAELAEMLDGHNVQLSRTEDNTGYKVRVTPKES